MTAGMQPYNNGILMATMFVGRQQGYTASTVHVLQLHWGFNESLALYLNSCLPVLHLTCEMH